MINLKYHWSDNIRKVSVVKVHIILMKVVLNLLVNKFSFNFFMQNHV